MLDRLVGKDVYVKAFSDKNIKLKVRFNSLLLIYFLHLLNKRTIYSNPHTFILDFSLLVPLNFDSFLYFLYQFFAFFLDCSIYSCCSFLLSKALEKRLLKNQEQQLLLS